jgi:hypothetical protein
MATRIILRHDQSTEWTRVNPILSNGEVGVEIDTLQFKVGDGQTAWNNLGYSNAKIKSSTINNKGELVVSYEDGKSYNVGKVKGTTITSTSVQYGTSSAPTITPSRWVDEVSSLTIAQGEYLWTKTTTAYDDGNTVVSYSLAQQGVDGAPGTKGADGRSITSITKTGTAGGGKDTDRGKEHKEVQPLPG